MQYEPYAGAEKRCSTCKNVKYLSEFSKNVSAKDGFQARCRACCAAKRRESRAQLRQRTDEQLLAERPESKICYVCRERLPSEDFATRRCSKDGLTADCRACRTNKIREQRERNRQRVVIDYPNSKKCPSCRKVLGRDSFAKSRAEKDGLQGYCRSCHKDARARSIAKKRSGSNNG